MTVPELQALWRHALDTADAALEAGRRAGTLSAAFCEHERRRIHAEREWVSQLRAP
jgi:hypothetical protein